MRRLRSRYERLRAKYETRIVRLSQKLMGNNPDGYVDELINLVPDLDGELLLSLSLFGIRSEEERIQLVSECMRLADAGAFLRKRICR